MDKERPSYCKKCGAILPPDAQFCEACGASVAAIPEASAGAAGSAGTAGSAGSAGAAGAAGSSFHPVTPTSAEPYAPQPGAYVPPPRNVPRLEDFYAEATLPDPSIPPRLGNALSKGWDLLWEDPLGAILVAVIFTIMVMVVNSVPLVNFFLMVALTVGLLGWAEERRRGLVSNPGSLFKITLDRFADSLLLGLVYLVLTFILAFPLIVLYFSFIFWIISLLGAGASGLETGEFPFWGQMSTFVFMTMVFWGSVFLIVAGPILNSLISLVSWAIALGKPFSVAIAWAWERIKRHFFGWWWAGLVISFLGGIGALFCYVGIFVSAPWSYLAWAEICGDKGETTKPSTY